MLNRPIKQTPRHWNRQVTYITSLPRAHWAARHIQARSKPGCEAHQFAGRVLGWKRLDKRGAWMVERMYRSVVLAETVGRY